MLLLAHRWLGIGGGVLFLVWFASGIVMIYARMPALAPEERLARADRLDLTRLRVSPAEAAGDAHTNVRFSLVTIDGRPAYRFGGGPRSASTIVFGDTGERREGVGVAQAWRAARPYAPGYDGYARHTLLAEPDQWTLQARAQLPAFRFSLDDEAGTEIYVSRASGEVILRTTRRERLWAYLGPVMHWLYFTPLRRNASLWTDVVIWSAIAGCVACITGIACGLLRVSPRRRFRVAGRAQMSPYAASLKWHHYTGLVFGLIVFTWTFSGLLSMGPGDFLSSQGLSHVRRQAASVPSLEGIAADDVRAAAQALTRHLTLKELEFVAVAGERYWFAVDAPAAGSADEWMEPALGPRRPLPLLDHRHATASRPSMVFRTFDESVLHRLANQATNGAQPVAAKWLDTHDAYYYDARGQRPLPVLRLEYADAERTWLYLDPARGTVALAHDRTSRTRRWLYQGLHSLDFPLLYDSRPLWDIVVIVLSAGGLVVGATAVSPAVRRMARLVRVRRKAGRIG